MNREHPSRIRADHGRDELDLDTIGAFHVRWYQPSRTAGPFHSRRELVEHLRIHALPRPDELLAPFDTQEVVPA